MDHCWNSQISMFWDFSEYSKISWKQSDSLQIVATLEYKFNVLFFTFILNIFQEALLVLSLTNFTLFWDLDFMKISLIVGYLCELILDDLSIFCICLFCVLLLRSTFFFLQILCSCSSLCPFHDLHCNLFFPLVYHIIQLA